MNSAIVAPVGNRALIRQYRQQQLFAPSWHSRAKPPCRRHALNPETTSSSSSSNKMALQHTKQQELDLLWAGYSDLTEQLRKARSHSAQVSEELERLQKDMAHMRQQQAASHPLLGTHHAWQAASLLLLCVGIINFASFVVGLQAASVFPFWAVKPAPITLLMKQALEWAVPFTNAAVILLFCIQAVKAAWHCLRW